MHYGATRDCMLELFVLNYLWLPSLKSSMGPIPLFFDAEIRR